MPGDTRRPRGVWLGLHVNASAVMTLTRSGRHRPSPERGIPWCSKRSILRDSRTRSGSGAIRPARGPESSGTVSSGRRYFVHRDNPQRQAIEVRPIAYGQMIVVGGALDARGASALLDAVSAFRDEQPVVVLDLNGATTIDAFGRAALRRIGQQATRLQQTVLVVAESATRQRMGDIGRLLDTPRLVSSRRIALAAAIAASVH